MDPLDWVMASIAICGTSGLFALGLAERLVPIIPSYAILVAIGIAVSEGVWPLPLAVVSITLGGIVGCAASFYGLRLIGAARSERVMNWVGRLFGISAERCERIRQAYRSNHTSLAFSLQLLPTFRLLSPILQVLTGGSARSFIAASALGIFAWNILFVGVGYLASSALAGGNTTILAAKILVSVITAQMIAFALAKRVKACRASPRASL